MIFLKERPLLFASKFTLFFSIKGYNPYQVANLVRNNNQPVTPHLSLRRSKVSIPFVFNDAKYGQKETQIKSRFNLYLKGFDLGYTTTLPFTLHPFRFVGLRPLLSLSFHWLIDGFDINYNHQNQDSIATSSLKFIDPLVSVKDQPQILKVSPFKPYDKKKKVSISAEQAEQVEQKNYRLGSHFFLSLQFFFCASFFFSLFRNEKNELNFSFLSFLSFIFKKKTSNDLSFVFKKKTDNDHFLSLLELLPLLLPKANSKKKAGL